MPGDGVGEAAKNGTAPASEAVSIAGVGLIGRFFLMVCLIASATSLLIDHFETGWSTLMAVVLLAGALGETLRRRWVRMRRRGMLKLLIVSGMLLAGFSTSELILRVAGFSFSSRIEFGWPPPQTISTNFKSDPDLFWALPTQFIGEIPEIEKAAGEVRIAYLGDSCTAQHGWVDLLHKALGRDSAAEVTYVNAGVHGYSSHQGIIRLERDVLPYAPDIVVVYFGWNDHWLARGKPDAEKTTGGVGQMVAESFMAESRVLQGIVKVSDFLHYKATVRRGDRGGPPNCRVSVDDYRANLARMIDLCEQAGAAVVLLTAPTNQTEETLERKLIRLSMVRTPREAIELHRKYNDVVRSVAAEGGVLLIDLDKRITGRSHCFMKDGIHFTEEGFRAVARAMIEPVKTLVRTKM